MERVLNVEKATFTPAVFLTTGGMSKECKRFVNRAADLPPPHYYPPPPPPRETVRLQVLLFRHL